MSARSASEASPRAKQAYEQLRARRRAAAVYTSTRALLSWDQEVLMPRKAGAFRAEQLEALARLAHQAQTDPALGELLEVCEADEALAADEVEAANLREIRRDYDRERKLPESLVAAIAKASSEAMEAWKEARARSDFALFAPHLERIVELSREKAQALGAPEGGELYDALLDEYEPGARAQTIEALFAPLRQELTAFLAQLREAPQQPSDAVDKAKVDVATQQRACAFVAERVGYDFHAGRLDVSTHPFTETMGPRDVRITTRYNEARFADSILTTLHEVGHALYEQGLAPERFGEPAGQAVGLGVHESQSRLWENQVGRSAAFWTWLLPAGRDVFAGALAGLSPAHVFEGVNRVRPHFIRVESDEATYHLHIMLRFDVERALLRQELAVKDVPAFWNERMERDLGLAVERDSDGCLQDIHWSMAAVGYFPTYTIGSLLACQLWEALDRELGGAAQLVERGEFAPILRWTRDNVHAHGRRFDTQALCRRVTGAPLSHEPLLRHLRSKLGPLYGLS